MYNRFLVLIAALALPVSLMAQKFELLATKTEHRSGIEHLELCPDGQTMVSADHSGNLVFWDLKTMTVTYRVRAHSALINTVLFDRSGKFFVTAGEDGKVKVWNYPELTLNYSYATIPNVNSFAVMGPDQKYVYFGGTNHNRSYNDDNGTYTQPYGGLYRVPFNGSTTRSELVFGGGEGAGYLNGHNITDGNLDREGKHVVITKDNFMYFVDLATNKLDYKVESLYGLNNFTCTNGVIYAWATGRIVLMENQGGKYAITKYVQAGTLSGAYYSKLVLSADGQHLVTGDDGNRVNIWNAKTLQKEQSLYGHTDAVRTFLYWNHDSVLITGGYDGQIRIWGYPKKEQEPKDTVISTPPKDSVIVQKPIDVVFSENNIPVTIKDRPVNKSGTFYVKTEEFEIEIWDNSVYDHDVISLNINGDWILENYEVTKEKKKIKIKVKPNTNNYLILYAHNLGEISPNTAAVGLLVDGKLQRLTVSSDLKQCGALNFEYKP